tara:strand:- start:11124 stop:12266 length:1143 start_codon:yes stop_codon:yes gene_type:complete
MKNLIRFNKPFITPLDSNFFSDLEENKSSLSGDGKYTNKVHLWLENYCKAKKALLTHSCTAALEMSAILLNIKEGDEVLMPSYTFVSTANAIVLRGGVPIFIDIREDTLNIDENSIERSINKKTKAILPVHYAGVSCEMDTINSIAKSYKLFVVEDSAQGILSKYKGKPLGSLGDLGAFSFHETKNIISGEGGALIVNNEKFLDRSQIIREKGTNRTLFKKGQVDKYSWCDVGSSYLPSELVAGFLLNQLNLSTKITKERLTIWLKYHELLESLEKEGFIRRPFIPEECTQNGHIYYIIVNPIIRNKIIEKLMDYNIEATTHYVPLHSSIAGKKYGKSYSSLKRTTKISESIIRLPLWIGLDINTQEYIVEKLIKILKSL